MNGEEQGDDDGGGSIAGSGKVLVSNFRFMSQMPTETIETIRTKKSRWSFSMISTMTWATMATSMIKNKTMKKVIFFS